MNYRQYSAIAVANAFLDIAKSKNVGLSPMKLQKLVYFAHAWYLAVRSASLIDEPVYAWKFGPVIKSVYHEFKSYGYDAITFPGTVLQPSGKADAIGNLGYEIAIPCIDDDDTDVQFLVENIWSVYGGMSAKQLSDLTHERDTAWGSTEQEHLSGMSSDFVLNNDLIKQTMRHELNLDQLDDILESAV